MEASAFVNWLQDWLDGNAPSNIWIGTSVEDQARADERIPELLKIPARVRFLSVEPQLGPVNFEQACGGSAVSARLDWAIFGGESGAGSRPCHVDWIRDGVKQCQAGGVKVFVKQLGSNPKLLPPSSASQDVKIFMRDRKGGDPAEWPEDLRNLREFPEVAK